MTDLTVITATIPGRETLLEEASRSVHDQTVAVPHLIATDVDRQGPAPTLNRLADLVETRWLFRLDDDDLLDRDHVEVLSHWLTDDADIVYTWCRIEGGGELHPERQFQVRLQATEGWAHLKTENWVPCAAAIRTSLWRDLGGLRDVPEEDWEFWRRALDVDARFRCVPAVTWTYRMNVEWEHRSGCVSSL